MLCNARRVTDDHHVSYKCDECNKSMVIKRGFLRHVRVHSDKRPCEYSICEARCRIEQDSSEMCTRVRRVMYAMSAVARSFARPPETIIGEFTLGNGHTRVIAAQRLPAPSTLFTCINRCIRITGHIGIKNRCTYCGKCFR